MGVRYPGLGEHESVAYEEFQDGRGFGRIDADGMVAVLYHPDVVVGQGFDGGNFHECSLMVRMPSERCIRKALIYSGILANAIMLFQAAFFLIKTFQQQYIAKLQTKLPLITADLPSKIRSNF